MKAIVLTRGRIATVDDEDFDRCNQFEWHAKKFGRAYYAARNVRLPDGSRTTEYLHNFILGVEEVDHRDGDGLENRRQNLRPATKRQNARGHRRKVLGATSRFRGVGWHKPRQKWQVQIRHRGKSIYLGLFAVEEDAARAYDKTALELFGEFATPNFPLVFES